MIDERHDGADKTRGSGYDHYNPVTVYATDTLGVVILGLFALILLVALLRVQARSKETRAP